MENEMIPHPYLTSHLKLIPDCLLKELREVQKNLGFYKIIIIRVSSMTLV